MQKYIYKLNFKGEAFWKPKWKNIKRMIICTNQNIPLSINNAQGYGQHVLGGFDKYDPWSNQKNNVAVYFLKRI